MARPSLNDRILCGDYEVQSPQFVTSWGAPPGVRALPKSEETADVVLGLLRLSLPPKRRPSSLEVFTLDDWQSLREKRFVHNHSRSDEHLCR